MKKENLREDLQPYYDETDCCHYIVEFRKENCELKEQVKKQKEVIDKLKGYLKLNIELIKEQPSNDELTDNFILQRFKSLLDILKEVSK